MEPMAFIRVQMRIDDIDMHIFIFYCDYIILRGLHVQVDGKAIGWYPYTYEGSQNVEGLYSTFLANGQTYTQRLVGELQHNCIPLPPHHRLWTSFSIHQVGGNVETDTQSTSHVCYAP
jgi:hypothetical protein